MKRLVSLVLAALMLTALIPAVMIEAYAEENDFNSGYIPDDVVRLIDDTYTGDGGSFSGYIPDNTPRFIDDTYTGDGGSFSGYIPDDEERLTDDVISWRSKLSAALIKEINTPTDVMIDVYIFLKDCPAKWHVDEIVSQKYTWTNEQEHLMYYRQEMAATIGPYVQQFIDDNADLLYKVICQIDSAEFIIAEVSKENVPKLAQLDIVQNMDTYGEYSEPTLITEMIAPAANERYYDPRHTITARDINLRDYYQFRDSDAYAVLFYVRNMCYIEVMIEERIGDWLFESAHPEPFLFVNDHLYGFKEAYDAGLMTDDMLEELAGSSFRGDYILPLLTRYIVGDADGSGDVDIIDATVIQRVEANITVTGTFYKSLADVDGDSEVSVIDATLIQRKEAGLYTIE